MSKRDSTRLAERSIAASPPLKPFIRAVGEQFWYRAAAIIGSVGIALLVWQSTGGPATGRDAQTPVAAMVPALAPGAMPATRQEAIPPSHLSPFGTSTAFTASTANTTNAAVLATTSEPLVRASAAPVVASENGTPGADRPVSGEAVPNPISVGPPPRSDMRYQVAATWRRAMPH